MTVLHFCCFLQHPGLLCHTLSYYIILYTVTSYYILQHTMISYYILQYHATCSGIYLACTAPPPAFTLLVPFPIMFLGAWSSSLLRNMARKTSHLQHSQKSLLHNNPVHQPNDEKHLGMAGVSPQAFSIRPSLRRP